MTSWWIATHILVFFLRTYQSWIQSLPLTGGQRTSSVKQKPTSQTNKQRNKKNKCLGRHPKAYFHVAGCSYYVFRHWYEYLNKSYLSMNRMKGYQTAKEYKGDWGPPWKRGNFLKILIILHVTVYSCLKTWVLHKILTPCKSKWISSFWNTSKSNTHSLWVKKLRQCYKTWRNF